MFTAYKQAKNTVMEALIGLKELLVRLGVTGISAEMINERVDKLAHDTFNLVVLGQYKRGKTTFINALLEADLLPTGIVPLTSIVTVIHYGENIAARVQFLDGSSRPVATAELIQYIAEAENPRNVKQVKLVDITYPSAYLKDGVRLIDTPGIGSVFKHNTDTTYEFIPMVDAAIFVLSADPPISQEECRFLADITQYVRKIFFVQNKIDYVAESEREQSLIFSKKVIELETNLKDVRIYPVSAKLALDGALGSDDGLIAASRIHEFKNDLENFLVAERKTTLLATTAHIARKWISEAELKIDLEKATLDLPLAQIEEKMARLKEYFHTMHQEKLDLAYLMKGELDRLNGELEKDLKAFKENTVKTLADEIRKFAEQRKHLNVTELANQLRIFSQEAIEQHFHTWQYKKEQEIKTWLDKTVQRFENKNNVLIENIKQLAASLFDVKCDVLHSNTTLTHKSDLYFLTELVKPTMLCTIDWLKKLLPKVWAQQALLKSTLAEMEQLVEMNCGRLRYDFHSRAARSLQEFKQHLDANLDNTMHDIIATIDAAVRQKQAGEAAVLGRKDELEAARQRLLSIAEVLAPF